MAIFKCKMCGGSLEISENATTAVCEYCGSQQTLPKLTDDKLNRLYERANEFRRSNEFDKASAIYEQILTENGDDAESYWSLVLCRYGVEYVEDPMTRKRLPTINRAQYTSIFDDNNYKSALKLADTLQKTIYEQEAAAINEIQKGILEISQKEEPFDIFICYKETDENGRRTRDSVYANDLYHQLTQEGFKVFFARITLEDKLGTAYEPYIFAALNSSKIMVVLGTKPEYFNAVWVKNEWSRYLSLIKNGEKKVLIPAYSGMDAYDLPTEFSHLQAQDMTQLGFMSDLIRGIKKILGVDQPKPVAAQPQSYVSNTGGGGRTETEALLKRAQIFLDNKEWESADEKCEAALDIDPENAKAYILKLLAQLHLSEEAQLSVSYPRNPLEKHKYITQFKANALEQYIPYKNALRYADDATAERLSGYNKEIKEHLQHLREQEQEAERVRQEQERIRKEQEALEKARKEKVAAKQRERAAMLNSRDTVSGKLTAAVSEKESLEYQIKNYDKMRTAKKQDCIKANVFAYCGIATFTVSMLLLVLGASVNEVLMPFFMLPFVGGIFFTVKIALARGDSPLIAGVAHYFTLGIYGVYIASKFIKENKAKAISTISLPQLKQQLEANNSVIRSLRNSLNEINKNIENFDANKEESGNE